MTTVTHPPRVVIKCLKEWGWEFRNGSGDHVVGTWRNNGNEPATVSLRTEGEINDHARSLVENAMSMPWERIMLGNRLVTPARTRAVKALADAGGEIYDKEGRATAKLADERLPSLHNLLRDMEHDGMIQRVVRGRRTFKITLVQHSPIVRKCLGRAERIAQSAAPEPEAAVPPQQPAPAPEETPEAPMPELDPALAFRRMLQAMLSYVSTLEASVANAEKLEKQAKDAMEQVGRLVEYGQAQRRRMQKMQTEMDELRFAMRKK